MSWKLATQREQCKLSLPSRRDWGNSSREQRAIERLQRSTFSGRGLRMPGLLRQIWNLIKAIGFRARKQKATVIAAGLLGIGLAAPTGIAMSLPVVMRFFPGTDVSRMPIYRPVLTVLAPEDSPLTEPLRNVIAKGYYEWCALFGEENRVKVMVMWNSPTMNGLMQINPVEVPDVSIGFRNLTPDTWAEMNRERVD